MEDRQTCSFLSTEACVQAANKGIDSILTLLLEMEDVTDLFKQQQAGKDLMAPWMRT